MQDRHVQYYIRWSSFFFSSRRRHTRLVSDWSSDVCSSDLSGGCLDSKSTASALLSPSPSQTAAPAPVRRQPFRAQRRLRLAIFIPLCAGENEDRKSVV